MNRLLALVPLLGACIIYDDGKCRHCDADGDEWVGDTGGQQDDGEDTSADAPDPEFAFTLTPGEASPGDVFIASLTVEGEFDLATIEDLAFVDAGVSICATSPRQDELLVTISVAADQALGPVDLLVYLPDGQAELVDDALTIVDPTTGDDGSGGADDGSGDGGTGTDTGGTSGGGTDDGSGGTGDGSGDGGSGC